MSQSFASGGQNIGALALISVLPMTILGLISFRIDWFDLLAVQGTLKSLLQKHSMKVAILQSIFVYKAISRFRTILLGWIPKRRMLGQRT